MPNRAGLQSIVIALSYVAFSTSTIAQALAPTKSESAQKTVLEKFGKAAAEYTMVLPQSNATLSFRKKSILNWTNPTRQLENGAIYLWTHQGRPEIIGTVFTYSYKGSAREKHVFHSLATSKVEAKFEGQSIWHPKKPGVNFKVIPKAATPADSTLRRKIQLKALARRFTATMEDLRSGHEQLELVATPLASYKPEKGPCKAGAIFSFAQGTDPEVLLLIEARKEKKTEAVRWHYAFARFNFYKLSGSLDKQKVWSVEYEPRFKLKKRMSRELRDGVYVSFKPF